MLKSLYNVAPRTVTGAVGAGAVTAEVALACGRECALSVYERERVRVSESERVT